MAESIPVQPVATVRTPRTDLSDDYWGAVVSTLEFDPDVVGADALAGLDTFSHVEVLFVFDQVDPAMVTTGARHPRGNTEWPLVGIFGQRGKNRPNRIGLSRCRISAVEGLSLTVIGLDAVEGTPVLDVKPWMDEFAPIGPTHQPAWSSQLMTNYYDAGS